MKITLLRHGQPDLSAWGKIDTTTMPTWIKAYNSAGVKHEAGNSNIEMLTKQVHNFIVCSHLHRSIHSAQMLGYAYPHLVDALFREAELPAIQIPLIKLAPQSWSMVYRLFWLIGISNRFLAKELIAKGWRGDASPSNNKYSGYRYWEFASYTLRT